MLATDVAVRKLTDLLDPDKVWEERDLPLGNQEPTHRLVPEAAGSEGHDAIEFAEWIGIELYDFQKQGLIDDLGYVLVTLRDGSTAKRWAAGETAEVLSRRNGKSMRIIVLILFALFVLGEQKILYTAHRDDTAKDVFDQVVAILKQVPQLWAEVVDSGPRYTNGQRSIELKSGQIVYFRTRGTDAGRGQGYQRLILDEDQNLTEEEQAALMPLVTGEPNAQLNYAGSAGGHNSIVQSRVRRSYDQRERGLCYRGWHADADDDFDDLELVVRTNPRLGRGLSYLFIAKEFARFSRSKFGRERVGVATYPRGEGEGWVIPKEAVERAIDEDSQPAEGAPLTFVLEADPQLEHASICVAARREDGAVHIEPIANDPGVLWVVDRTKRLVADHGGDVWLDPKGPLGYLIEPLREAGIPVKLLEIADLKDAATWLYTAMNPLRDEKGNLPDPGVRHRGAPKLMQSFATAEQRKFQDRWTLRRTVSQEIDQSPLIGCMFAGWAVVKGERRSPPPAPRRVGQKGGPRPAPGRRGRRTSTADLSKAGF